jgi:hypothetical protein
MKQIKRIELLVGEVTFVHVFLNIPVKPKARLNKLVITCKEQRTTGRYVLEGAERGSAFSLRPPMVPLWFLCLDKR